MYFDVFFFFFIKTVYYKTLTVQNRTNRNFFRKMKKNVQTVHFGPPVHLKTIIEHY